MKAALRLFRELLATFRRLWPALGVGPGLPAGVLAFSLGAAVLDAAGVGLLLPLIGLLQGDVRVLEGRWLKPFHDRFPDWTPGGYLAGFCALALAAIFAKNLLSWLAQNLSLQLTARAGAHLRERMYARLEAAPLEIFERTKSGELAQVFTVEVSRTLQTLEISFQLFQRFAIGCCYVVLIFLLSWQLTLVLLAVLGAVGLLGGGTFRRLKRRGAEHSQVYHEAGGFLSEVFAGLRVIRVSHAESRFREAFQRINRRWSAVMLSVGRLQALIVPVSESLAVLGAMLVIVGAHHFLIRTGRLDAASLTLLGFVVIRLLPLINQLYSVFGNLTYMFAGVQSVENWLRLPAYPVRPFGSARFEGLRHALELDRVGYTYANGTTALHEVSFHIPAGAQVALVGPSGSGKTTLVNLLLRLREPQAGAIRVDGTAHWEFSPESWNGRLGVVDQDAFLFHDSVRQNLAVGCPGASDQELWQALDAAHLREVVEALPQGLDTVLGERGMTLSGGQKQRLAIARALLRKPDLLVLDEATSALDNVSEREVQTALDAARRGRTSVVIAHRLSTIRNADLIVVLDHGRVVDVGRWDELAARPGVFQRLVEATRIEHPDAAG